MADCELKGTCIFFNDKMADMPSMANIYKTRYCETDNSQCARYDVFKQLGRGSVPADLYPNDSERAVQLVNA